MRALIKFLISRSFKRMIQGINAGGTLLLQTSRVKCNQLTKLNRMSYRNRTEIIIENVNKENKGRNTYQTAILTDSETGMRIEMVK